MRVRKKTGLTSRAPLPYPSYDAEKTPVLVCPRGKQAWLSRTKVTDLGPPATPGPSRCPKGRENPCLGIRHPSMHWDPSWKALVPLTRAGIAGQGDEILRGSVGQRREGSDGDCCHPSSGLLLEGEQRTGPWPEALDLRLSSYFVLSIISISFLSCFLLLSF